jgi:endogenous inhibitor of DNA gyrase (YacG/DUF329 family)
MGEELIRMPCPSCGQRIKFGVEDDGTEAYCPHCDAPVVLQREVPPPPKPSRGLPKAALIGIPVAAFVLVFGIILAFAVMKKGNAAGKAPAEGQEPKKEVSEAKSKPSGGGAKASKKVVRLKGYKRPFDPPKEEKLVFNNPTQRRPGDPMQLMGHKIIDAQSGRMQYVVGQVKNHTKTRFFDVEIFFDLLDEKGKKIAEAKDYVGSLSGDETWEFKATIYNRGVKSAKLLKIDKDPE